MLKILVSFFSQTGNTEKVANAIYEEALSKGHDTQLKKIKDVSTESLADFDLVFLGSAVHGADIARPVKKFLDEVT
jgi:flavodoxin